MCAFHFPQVFLRRVYDAVAEGVEVDVLAEVIGGFHSDAFHLCDLLWMGRVEVRREDRR